MPDVALLSARGQLYRSWLPSVFQESPEHLAVIHALAREFDLLYDAIAQVRAQFFPQSADLLLGVWETLLKTTVAPAGATTDQRRATILALIRQSVAEGREWEAAVTDIVGPGWTYTEFVPHGSGTPPIYTILIVLPYAPSSDIFMAAEARIREITPAHIDLQIDSNEGFVLDESELDQEGLG